MFDTIYCDLDGVHADFHLEAVRAHLRVGRRFQWLEHYGTPLELSHEHLYKRWPRGHACQKVCCPEIGDVQDYWEEVMGKFWAPIRLDPFFWRNMPRYSWSEELVKLLRQHCKHLVFVTTPDIHYNCYAGKRQWLDNHGLADAEVVFMKNKWRLARERCLLIDDFEGHVKAWREHGFPAMLFPQPWNERHVVCSSRLSYVKNYLETATDA